MGSRRAGLGRTHKAGMLATGSPRVQPQRAVPCGRQHPESSFPPDATQPISLLAGPFSTSHPSKPPCSQTRHPCRGRSPARTCPSLIMSPANSTPRNGTPSAHIARAVGTTMSRMACSSIAGVSTGAGE